MADGDSQSLRRRPGANIHDSAGNEKTGKGDNYRRKRVDIKCKLRFLIKKKEIEEERELTYDIIYKNGCLHGNDLYRSLPALFFNNPDKDC